MKMNRAPDRRLGPHQTRAWGPARPACWHLPPFHSRRNQRDQGDAFVQGKPPTLSPMSQKKKNRRRRMSPSGRRTIVARKRTATRTGSSTLMNLITAYRTIRPPLQPNGGLPKGPVAVGTHHVCGNDEGKTHLLRKPSMYKVREKPI
jgi:hypothetical protein